jgi:hypothetical protein
VVDKPCEGLAEGGEAGVVLRVVGLDVLVVPEATQNGPQSLRQVLLLFIDGIRVLILILFVCVRTCV